MESLILDFRKSPDFLQKWNKEFDVEDIGTNCFYIVLVDGVCDDNIEDCLNADGQLVYSQSHFLSGEPIQCSLKYVVDGNAESIQLDGDVTYTFGSDESFDMKGFFVTNDTGYVFCYSLNTYTININTSLTIEDGLTLITVVEGTGNE